MDVDDNIGQWMQLIEVQRKKLQQAKKRQGQKPRDRQSRQYTYNRFMTMLELTHERGTENAIYSSFIPPAYPPCVAPLIQLKRIMIRDLQLETHHRGTYLLLRSITPPNRMTAVMAVVEDEYGDVVALHLYQQDDEDVRAAAEIIDVGTILLLKEPFFKVTGDGEYGLRVDHVSDLGILKADDARVPVEWQPRVIEVGLSSESLKIKGNQAMKDLKYWQAIQAYSDALDNVETTELKEILHRNRSLAYLKTKQFDAALAETAYPDFNKNPTERTMFRAAQALYNIDVDKCRKLLEQLHANYPQNNEALEFLKRAQARNNERVTGIYDFKKLQKEAAKLQPPHLDHATYLGPLEIKQTETRGRGLFVTKDVKAGDLLLCEKAFAHAYAKTDAESDDDENGSSKISLLMNVETKDGFMGTQAELIKIIVQMLHRNPSIAAKFTKLYHGSYEAVSLSMVDSKPIVDSFLVERIVTFNVFGCPRSSLNSHNEFIKKSTLGKGGSIKKGAHHSCGIWTQASYINHSCYSNARRAFIGDMMIIRASRDIDAGSEITFWYQSPHNMDFQKLQKKLKHWHFVCECAICSDTKATDPAVLQKRRSLMQDLKKVFNSPSLGHVQINKIERLLHALNATYTQPAETIPRILLPDPQITLMHIFATQNMHKKSLEWAGNVLKSLGFIVVGEDLSKTQFAIVKWGLLEDHLVQVFLIMEQAFFKMDALDSAKQAGEYARTVFKIIVGEDVSFEKTYG